MKFFFRVFLISVAVFYSSQADAGITDSLFSIKDTDQRLLMVEHLFQGYDIKSKEALQFKNEVLQKGNASEKLIISWMWEDRQLGMANMDSNIAVFNKYLPQVQKTGNPNLLAILYSVKANALLYSKRYSRAFENYLYAYDNLKKDPDKEYYNQSWVMYNIAMNFYLFKDYAKTIEMTYEVSKLPPPVSYDTDWFNCINYDLLAMAYLKSASYDSAAYWLNRTFESAVKSNDSAWIGIAKGNMGLLYFEQNMHDKAIPFFEQGIAYCTAEKVWDNVSPFASSLAHIYIIQKDFTRAAAYLQIAKDATSKHYKLDNSLLYYNTASFYEKAVGNYSYAFQMLDSARIFEKRSSSEFEISKRTLAESRVAYEKQRMDNAMLQEKAQNEEWRFYGMVIILLLLLTAFILFVKRQKLRYSLQQKTLQNEKLKAEKELSVALYEIKEFTYHVTQKNKAIENLLMQVQHLKEQHKDISNEEVEAIEEDMKQSAMLTEEGWVDFNTMFEKAFPGLIEKLKLKLPELNTMQRRYFKLLKLELDKKDIAGMLGLEEDAIETLRTELVQALELTDKDEIEILLESL
ncbi:MAG: tetratricopeptide repeat protein [Sphingobacteriales bacterium]|nr:MAG: tetratricopeptide repeat protein [Sphingobacteriales bacterium]